MAQQSRSVPTAAQASSSRVAEQTPSRVDTRGTKRRRADSGDVIDLTQEPDDGHMRRPALEGIIDLTHDSGEDDIPSGSRRLRGTDTRCSRTSERRGSGAVAARQPSGQERHGRSSHSARSDEVWVWAFVEDGSWPEEKLFNKTSKISFTRICTDWDLALTDPIAIWLSFEEQWRFIHVEELANIPFCLREDDYIVWAKWGIQDIEEMFQFITNSDDADAPEWPDAESVWQRRLALVEEYDRRRAEDARRVL